MRELTDLERDLLDADRWHDLACLRLDLLERLHARAQRLEAALVLVEDQRDAARKERDTLREQLNDLQAGMRQWEDEHASAVTRVIAERDALRAELHHERQQHASTREILRAMERGNT